jgi:FtsP/CotA-like multicopper oxidase with cupredoxin domain
MITVECSLTPPAARLASALWLTVALFPAAGEGQPASSTPPATSSERVAINDNRTPAGTLTGATLTVRLEARLGEWHPDRDSDHGVVVKAFAVEGGPLQVPGPVIRVREGTDIRASIRNSLSEPLVLRGFYSRPASASGSDGVTVAPGETKEVAFAAGRAGTYYYWGASSADTALPNRAARDSQLVGALIVDPRGEAPAPDRVLLISNWPAPTPDPLDIGRMVINGRSWPHTERLAYKVGDTVRMRLINAGAAVHPMHLHGFYFKVDSRGDERADTVFAPGSSPRMAVTERLAPGRTFSLTWKPTRPGNWLFHCHDNVHLARGVPLGPETPPAHQHVADHAREMNRAMEMNHAMEMMAGPVMGISVTGPSAEPASAAPRRHLTLVARVDEGGTQGEPAFGYTLHAGVAKTPPTPPPPYLPGPTILLKRGEPVGITIKNELPEPTAVHWHGIELESYFDGVAGYSGEGRRITPAIPTGGSFEARFTPPRSGTFIYHTHVDEIRQQQAGLSGALLVVDDPASFNAARDWVMLITIPRKTEDANTVVLLNGSAQPAPREMRVGERYRLRFINAHTFRPSMRMRLLRESALLEWRALAKDGMDLPADQALTGAAEVQMGNGETYDFEFAPTSAGEIRVDVTSAAGELLVSMPIKVR